MAELLSQRDLITLVDRLILEQGRFSGLQLLVAVGWLRQADVDDLLADRPRDLLQCIRLPPLATTHLEANPSAIGAALLALCDQAMAHARAQGLVADDAPGLLPADRIGLPAPLAERVALALGTVFRPAAERRQPDLFQDSTVMLIETYLCAALTRWRPRAARAALARLVEHAPPADRFAQWEQLVAAVAGELPGLPAAPARGVSDAPTPGAGLTPPRQPVQGPPVSEPDSGPGSEPGFGLETDRNSGPAVASAPDRAAAERAWATVEQVAVTARDLLGRQAALLMQPLWRRLAQVLAGHRFDPAAPQRHAATAWARAGCWSEARWALEVEPDWGREPGLTVWHARLCWQAGDATAARRDWLSLCWSAPAEAIRVLDAADLPDTALALAWQSFGDLDEPLPTTSFPTWLLLAEPALVAAIGDDAIPSSAPGAVFRQLRAMLAGDDGVAQRKALAAQEPKLLRLYLRSRAG